LELRKNVMDCCLAFSALRRESLGWLIDAVSFFFKLLHLFNTASITTVPSTIVPDFRVEFFPTGEPTEGILWWEKKHFPPQEV